LRGGHGSLAAEADNGGAAFSSGGAEAFIAAHRGKRRRFEFEQGFCAARNYSADRPPPQV
jgi:hypothetical protein